jgi:hypothetical protein
MTMSTAIDLVKMRRKRGLFCWAVLYSRYRGVESHPAEENLEGEGDSRTWPTPTGAQISSK